MKNVLRFLDFFEDIEATHHCLSTTDGGEEDCFTFYIPHPNVLL